VGSLRRLKFMKEHEEHWERSVTGRDTIRGIHTAKPVAGILLTALILSGMTAGAATRYVNVNGTNPTPPFTSWDTAAAILQDALDAATGGDTVLVTNGVYFIGGRSFSTGSSTNRALITKPLLVQSVNGPTVTVIQGYQVPGTTNGFSAIRCVYFAYSSSPTTLSGFTLATEPLSVRATRKTFRVAGYMPTALYARWSPTASLPATLRPIPEAGCTVHS
jgi:hypothetical protein